MSLGSKQRVFMYNIGKLILWAYEQGYELTLGDGYRDPRLHGDYGESGSYGSKKSNHKIRLAIDLNLFKDGVYLTSTEDHAPLGAYWKSLNEENEWGGVEDDGNHYSMRHWGRW